MQQREAAGGHRITQVGHNKTEMLLQAIRAERVAQEEGDEEVCACGSDGERVGLHHEIANHEDDIVELSQHKLASKDDAQHAKEGGLQRRVLEVDSHERDQPAQLHLVE